MTKVEPKLSVSNIPPKIVLSDLMSKYQEIDQETDQVQFFIKIAHYGKYILENTSTTTILAPLFLEAKEDSELYKHSWREFIKVWKPHAKDLLEKAEKAGITDNPSNPLSNEIGVITERLNAEEGSVWESDLENYYMPYQTLLWKFKDVNKMDLLIPKHLSGEDNSLVVLYPAFSRARDAWDKFKYSREAKVWWAHYQICRLAGGILDLEITKDYFQKNRVIDMFYKFEFHEVAKGNINRSPIVLHQNKFATWIKRLHEYLIPRLENFPNRNYTPTTVGSLKNKKIGYDDKEARILIDSTICQLPPFKNEHYLCRVMFRKKINLPVDWSVVFEKMSGDYEKYYGKPSKTRENWRTVYDTMIRINDRVKKELHTTDDLFSWQELTIKRNF